MTERFDAGGVRPGLTAEAPKVKTVNLRCRNSACDSFEAAEIQLHVPGHHGQHLYRCVKCNHTWGVALGGHIDI